MPKSASAGPKRRRHGSGHPDPPAADHADLPNGFDAPIFARHGAIDPHD